MWSNERVVVFTEYAHTVDWLTRVLNQKGYTDDRLAVIQGSTPTDEREYIRSQFTADPTKEPVRVLLATDAAGEGIDLQTYCHRLVNFDIPFNPSRLEQRIGRIDRYGQNKTPEVRHFVGTGWKQAVDSYEADLEFLSRVAAKVAQMEEDLGAVNAVLAEAVQRPTMKFVATKTADQLDLQALHRVRSGWSASAPALSIRSAPSCWSAALRCGRDNASCVPSCRASLPHPPTSCRHGCSA